MAMTSKLRKLRARGGKSSRPDVILTSTSSSTYPIRDDSAIGIESENQNRKRDSTEIMVGSAPAGVRHYRVDSLPTTAERETGQAERIATVSLSSNRRDSQHLFISYHTNQTGLAASLSPENVVTPMCRGRLKRFRTADEDLPNGVAATGGVDMRLVFGPRAPGLVTTARRDSPQTLTTHIYLKPLLALKQYAYLKEDELYNHKLLKLHPTYTAFLSGVAPMKPMLSERNQRALCKINTFFLFRFCTIDLFRKYEVRTPPHATCIIKFITENVVESPTPSGPEWVLGDLEEQLRPSFGSSLQQIRKQYYLRVSSQSPDISRAAAALVIAASALKTLCLA
ncbi:hypothetical protein EVAR_61841_1 [Eumeta japonica]|uniref:Uncharacterized protein n=1 Tax=Eumeta variegata TaxID=151549 RepID=A0A4C1YT04_EUMVA|nr:hypothetical protein EVAR_61841_1 [Eumeta japonica]